MNNSFWKDINWVNFTMKEKLKPEHTLQTVKLVVAYSERTCKLI